MYTRENPEKAFVTLRMISQATEHLCRLHLEQVYIESLLEFSESSLEMVEWDDLDVISGSWIDDHSAPKKSSSSLTNGRLQGELLRYNHSIVSF